MAAFREFFTAPVWDHVLVLVTGAVLTTGKRTVSAVLRVMGLSQSGDFALYHHVLSQARWDSRAIARQLLRMILERFLPSGSVIIGIDDTSSGAGARRSRRAASTAIRCAPRTVISSRRAACAGFPLWPWSRCLHPPTLGLAIPDDTGPLAAPR